MTKRRDALAKAREVIGDIREQDFVSYTIGRDPATMDETEAEIIAEYDAALALIDAALAEPGAPDVERIARAIADATECAPNVPPCQDSCLCMISARAVAALYGAPPDAGALLAAAKALIASDGEYDDVMAFERAIAAFDAENGTGGAKP